MNREAIFHNPVSNYAFPISYEKFKVRLRAGKGDLDRVTLVIGNKYLWHTRKEVPMEVEGSDEPLLGCCKPKGLRHRLSERKTEDRLRKI